MNSETKLSQSKSIGFHPPKITEQTINDELGRLLRESHPRWRDSIDTEKTRMLMEGAGQRPDVIVRHPGGQPVIIETELFPARSVEKDAKGRLGRSFTRDGNKVEQSISLCVPAEIALANQSQLSDELRKAKYKFCVHFEQGKHFDSLRWPETGWVEGGLDDLVAFIEHTALSESRIAHGMQILETGISQAAHILREGCATAPFTLKKIATRLHQKDSMQTSRMAMAIIVNALSFQSAITGTHEVPSVNEMKDSDGDLTGNDVLKVWKHILKNINYWPIFEIASEILKPVRERLAIRFLNKLADVVANLEKVGATSQHDLSGRMFQRLITDRKFLATFYTLPSSATLLAEIAVSRMNLDWSSKEALVSSRIVDFACGTGALLNAAYSSILARYRRAGNDDAEIHSKMLEDAVVGTDIMPAATHLTASILSSVHPSIPFEKTKIMTLPYGKNPDSTGEPIALGALDLVQGEEVFSLFRTGQERMRGKVDGETEHVELPHNAFDLVIMNPPFSRATGHEGNTKGVPIPSFAGFETTEEEQRKMSKKLSENRHPQMAGHGNAGLASNFIDIAHAKIKKGGVVAFVLPATFASGKSWSAARKLFENFYQDIVVVSIAIAGSQERAFSADTGIAEVLVIARRSETESSKGVFVTYVNLERRPNSILEAHLVARTITDIPETKESGLLKIGSEKLVGRFIRSRSGFSGSAGVREIDLVSTALGLENGKLKLPQINDELDIPVTRLEALGQRGVLARDINGPETTKDGFPRGPFDVEKIFPNDIPTYPILWAHEARKETKMVVYPNRQGITRKRQETSANKIWNKFSSQLGFSRDFQLNSQPLVACLISRPSLASQAWSGFVCDKKEFEKPIILWSNTTLGLISFWWLATRQQQGRARLTVSKLPLLVTLDVRELTVKQHLKANELFESFSGLDLLPANEAYRDEVRQALDEAVFIDLLGQSRRLLEPLRLIRTKWCMEPSVHGGKSTRPSLQQRLS